MIAHCGEVRFFVVAIEAAIDLGRHVIASEGLRAPDSSSEVFTVLGEAGEQAARFRNLLVHQYATVDDRRVVDLLSTQLADLDRFRGQISEALSQGE